MQIYTEHCRTLVMKMISSVWDNDTKIFVILPIYYRSKLSICIKIFVFIIDFKKSIAIVIKI